MKKYLSIIVSVIVIISLSSCSSDKIYKIPISETKEHFNSYVEVLHEYKDYMDAFWYGREGYIMYDFGSSSIDFELYNHLPDELFSLKKNTADDDGYEKYRLYAQRKFEHITDLCNFDEKYSDIISVLLSKVTYKNIPVDDIEKVLNKSDFYKINNKFKSSGKENLDKKIIYDKTLYIDSVWCNYKLSYDPNSSKCFREEMEFGGESRNNYVNLQQYE